MAAITRTKSWVSNETLTASDLNAEFDGINTWLTTGNPVHLSTLTVGVDDAGHDVKFFGDTASAHLLWDASADTLKLVGGAKINAQGTVTVGVNDTGYDVKFFGATSGAYMLWDESADDLVLAGAAGLDIAGDIDVDGTTNLDAVDIDGNVQIDATVTVGVDDTGYDVKFFGAAAGAFALWDESANLLEIRGATAAGPGHLKLTTGEATVVDGDILGRIDFQAPAETGTDAILVAASIWAEADDTFAADNNETELVFCLASSDAEYGSATSGATFERMRLTSLGRLGIGTASPNAPLNVKNDQNATTAININNATAGTAAAATFGAASDTADLNIRVTSGSFTSSGANTPDTCIVMAETSASGGLHLATADTAPVSIYVDGSERVNVDSNGTVFINDTVNAKMTVGLTVNQGANTNEIISLKSNVSHDHTDLTEADTFANFKESASTGGVTLNGFSAAGEAMHLYGLAETPATTDTTSSVGVLSVLAAKTNGAQGWTLLGNDDNLFTFSNYGTTKFLIKGDGDLHATNISSGGGDLNAVALDAEDDVGLIRTYERGLHSDIGVSISKWDEQIKVREDDLRRVGVLTGDFYSVQRMNSLLGGGIWQIHCRQQDLKEVVDYQQEEIESLKKELLLLKEAE